MTQINSNSLAYLIIFILYSVWFLAFEGWMWFRRNKQPLKARGVLWLALVDIPGYLFLISICWKEIVGNENFSCVIKSLANNICPPIFFLGYFARVWKLYFMFQIQDYDTSKQDDQQNNSWFFQNKKYARNTFLFLFYIVVVLVWLIISIIELLTIGAYHKATNCVPSVADVVPIVITSITAILSLFTVTFRLRSVHDGFKMVWELRILASVWFLLGVAYIVVRGLVLGNGDLPQINILLIILIIVTQLVSIVWPLRLTYTPYFYKQFTNDSQEYDFGQLLSSEQGVQQFKAFIQGEFSVENLLFWDAVNKLENESDEAHRNKMQKSIYDLYIKENAALQVSINSKLRANIDTAYNEKGDLLPLFKKAKDRIYTQMQDDSFGRFVMSDQFKEIRQTVFRLDNPADKQKEKIITSEEDIEATDPFSCCGTSK